MNEKVTDLVKSGPVRVSSETWCPFPRRTPYRMFQYLLQFHGLQQVLRGP